MNYRDYHRLRERLPQLDQIQVMMDTRSFEDFLLLLGEAADIKLSRMQDIEKVMKENDAGEKMDKEIFSFQMLTKQMEELTKFKQALISISEVK